MNELNVCERCGGFVSSNAAVCPHCDAPHCEAPPPGGRRRRWAVLLGLAGSASLGLTMMACYGAPPCEPHTNGCGGPLDAGTDAGVDGAAH